MALDHEYLILKEDWTRQIKREILDPLRDQALRHPFIQEIAAGTLPRYKIIRMLQDLLWVIDDFGQAMAGLAARAPVHLHDWKRMLLENAISELDHPATLIPAIRALGGQTEGIIDQPDFWQPQMPAKYERDWTFYYALEAPWIEGVAAITVGVEGTVPSYYGVIGDALRDRYGVAEDDLLYFEIHGGEVEQGHGNDGLRLLESLVRPYDVETQAACYRAIKRISYFMAVEWLDWYYAARES